MEDRFDSLTIKRYVTFFFGMRPSRDETHDPVNVIFRYRAASSSRKV